MIFTTSPRTQRLVLKALSEGTIKKQNIHLFQPATDDIVKAIQSKKLFMVDVATLSSKQLIEVFRLNYPEKHNQIKEILSPQNLSNEQSK